MILDWRITDWIHGDFVNDHSPFQKSLKFGHSLIRILRLQNTILAQWTLVVNAIRFWNSKMQIIHRSWDGVAIIGPTGNDDNLSLISKIRLFELNFDFRHCCLRISCAYGRTCMGSLRNIKRVKKPATRPISFSKSVKNLWMQIVSSLIYVPVKIIILIII